MIIAASKLMSLFSKIIPWVSFNACYDMRYRLSFCVKLMSWDGRMDGRMDGLKKGRKDG